QRRAGLEIATLLGGLDHRQADAVLDRSSRVRTLQFQVQLADAGIQALGLDDGRVANEFEDGGMDGHRRVAHRAATAAGPAIIRWMALEVRQRPVISSGRNAARATTTRGRSPSPARSLNVGKVQFNVLS